MNNQVRKFERRGNFFPSFFNHYFNDDFFNNFIEGSLPATNVKENKKEFELSLCVPGFDKEDLKIEIEKNILKISANKEMNKDEKSEDEKILRREFTSSSFVRSFAIPENIDTQNISATQKDGILHVTLPKLEKVPEDKIKKIEVK